MQLNHKPLCVNETGIRRAQKDPVALHCVLPTCCGVIKMTVQSLEFEKLLDL